MIALIPARYMSSRLPGKLLLDVGGKPLILHTLGQAKKARLVSRVIVAADDERIVEAVARSGNEAVLTSRDHESGSDRLAEVAERFDEHTIVVNVQGDEPLISPETIDLAVEAILETEEADITTVCERMTDPAEVLNPDAVKVVTDEHGFAIFFSRSPIPFPRDAVARNGDLESALLTEPELLAGFRKHTGLYVYRREALLRFCALGQSPLERTERLEQLRALAAGMKIKVVEAAHRSIGVDTESDLRRVRRIIEQQEPIAAIK